MFTFAFTRAPLQKSLNISDILPTGCTRPSPTCTYQRGRDSYVRSRRNVARNSLHSSTACTVRFSIRVCIAQVFVHRLGVSRRNARAGRFRNSERRQAPEQRTSFGSRTTPTRVFRGSKVPTRAHHRWYPWKRSKRTLMHDNQEKGKQKDRPNCSVHVTCVPDVIQCVWLSFTYACVRRPTTSDSEAKGFRRHPWTRDYGFECDEVRDCSGFGWN
jgi:hypothetical protein